MISHDRRFLTVVYLNVTKGICHNLIPSLFISFINAWISFILISVRLQCFQRCLFLSTSKYSKVYSKLCKYARLTWNVYKSILLEFVVISSCSQSALLDVLWGYWCHNMRLSDKMKENGLYIKSNLHHNFMQDPVTPSRVVFTCKRRIKKYLLKYLVL